MTADRGSYAEAQEGLLRALLAGVDFPAGFAPEPAGLASRALRRKRGRLVVRAWPTLEAALGAAFDEEFDAFARAVAAPAAGGGVADGLAFAIRLVGNGRELAEDLRVSVLMARADFAGGRGGAVRRRRGPFLGVVRLREPRQLLVVARIPVVGTAVVALPNGRN